MEITSENVMRSLCDRVPDALTFLIDQHEQAISAMVVRILAGLGTAEDVEECVSDVFVAAWRRASHYDPTRGTVRTWLLMLAKYRALDVRRRLAQPQHPAPDPCVPASDPVVEALLSRERQQALVEHIERLEPGVRAVVVRRYLAGMPIPDIAEDLGITRSAVDNRLSRGRRQIQEYWDMEDEGGGSVENRRH